MPKAKVSLFNKNSGRLMTGKISRTRVLTTRKTQESKKITFRSLEKQFSIYPRNMVKYIRQSEKSSMLALVLWKQAKISIGAQLRLLPSPHLLTKVITCESVDRTWNVVPFLTVMRMCSSKTRMDFTCPSTRQ